MHHGILDGRRNPALKLMKMEVDPLETYNHLKAIRDDLVQRFEQRLTNIKYTMEQAKEKGSDIGYALRQINHVGDNKLIETIGETEQAMRAIFNSCFECHDVSLPDSRRRGYMRNDFPLKINPYAENLAASVITGCQNISTQREQARVREYEAQREKPRDKSNLPDTPPRGCWQHVPNN